MLLAKTSYAESDMKSSSAVLLRACRRRFNSRDLYGAQQFNRTSSALDSRPRVGNGLGFTHCQFDKFAETF
jgi:hypothetical protein